MTAQRWFTLGAAVLLLAAISPPVTGSFHEPTTAVPDRLVVLTMSGHAFNGMSWPNTPLIEAYLGEKVGFVVTVPIVAEPHTFHLHGHPWPVDGKMVDTFLLRPGDTHRFTIVAGGVDRHPGDWMYHCHIDSHVSGGMWGVFRVYPYRVALEGEGATFAVHLDRLGAPLDDATLTLTLDGAPIAAHVTPTSNGHYSVHAPALDGATGELVVTSEHDWGQSVARLPLGGTETRTTRLEVALDGLHDGLGHE